MGRLGQGTLTSEQIENVAKQVTKKINKNSAETCAERNSLLDLCGEGFGFCAPYRRKEHGGVLQ